LLVTGEILIVFLPSWVSSAVFGGFSNIFGELADG
jgi:hypothetical protein